MTFIINLKVLSSKLYDSTEVKIEIEKDEEEKKSMKNCFKNGFND